MLAKIYRLPPSEKFENAKTFSSLYFHILIKHTALPHNRFGFVISKKVDKRAVVRNRLRRVLSESVKDWTIKGKGKDILIIVKKNFIDVPSQELYDIVQAILERNV